MASKMIRRVQCAKTPKGVLVEVEQGSITGYAIGDTIYATSEEAETAAGRINQQCYIDDQLSEIEYGLESLIDSASPFAAFRRKYDDDERQRDLVEAIMRELFPKYGLFGLKRSKDAQRFADAFVKANEAYNELHRV